MAANRKLEDEKTARKNKLQLEMVYKASENLLRNSKHSDVTIICGSKTWNCHRDILCQRCPFFEAALNKSFKEANTQKIDLSKDEFQAVEMLLLYLYTLQYPPINQEQSNILWQARLAFEIADKYQVSELKEAAKQVIIDSYDKRILIADKAQATGKVAFWNNTRELLDLKVDASDDIKKVVLQETIENAEKIVEHEAFIKLLIDRPAFMEKFVKGVAAKKTYKQCSW